MKEKLIQRKDILMKISKNGWMKNKGFRLISGNCKENITHKKECGMKTG